MRKKIVPMENYSQECSGDLRRDGLPTTTNTWIWRMLRDNYIAETHYEVSWIGLKKYSWQGKVLYYALLTVCIALGSEEQIVKSLVQ